ncbi:MAG TPA: tetratricopeptide repeat protein [Termitinemataceae bacterium]|nr:tetratricopeptide repeat protein [Termitinemataceae bacterium]HOM24091.1 tetratricopeptide repeat protein [Termitinemataceae bacterium]HPQ00026.1 tetratricopeptide repeat protein [Termitinemataceae bacterium]
MKWPIVYQRRREEHPSRKKGFLSILVIGGLLFSCALTEKSSLFSDSYFTTAPTKYEASTLSDLFSLLQKETYPGETQFSIVREIATEYLQTKDYHRLINFVTLWSTTHPEDPYQSYLLFMVAYAYLEQGMKPVAALYFDRIVKNYPDLMVQGKSIHLECLNRLIELVPNPQQQIWYYQELISRFPQHIDLGKAYFLLAKNYEKIGKWEEAIQNYSKFLPYYTSIIPGYPDALDYAKKIVDFYNSPKDWTFDSLDSLVKAIKGALDAGNSNLLNRYKAKVNFFALSWGQEYDDRSSGEEVAFSPFMAGNRIRYAAEVDASSNPNEAFLKTWGWSQRMSTWYFYFRKINFPADPNIHGRWEWAGIFYGEKL